MNGKTTGSDLAFFVLTVVLSAAFGAYLSSHRVTDPFLYFDVSFVKQAQLEGAMLIPDQGPYASLGYVPGREMLMVQLANMLGVTPEVLQFLPLGAIFASQCLYLLGLRLLTSPVLASLVALYLTFNLSHAAALYSVFGYGLGLPLFVATMLVAMRFIEKRGHLELALLVLLFIATHLVHYTLAVWAIASLLGANMSVWIKRRRSGPNTAGAPAHYLFLSCVVIFLGFNQVFYRSFLPMVSPDTLAGAIQRFVSYSAIDGIAAGRSAYLFTRPGPVSLVSAATLLVILVPVAVGVAIDVRRFLAQRSTAEMFDGRHPMLAGLLLTGVIDSLSYTVRGSISTKTLSMLFPLLSVHTVGRLNRKPAAHAFAAALLLLSLVKIGIFSRASYVIRDGAMSTGLADVRASADWLQDHGSLAQYTVLADLNLYGKLLLASVGQPRQPILAGFSLNLFERVIGATSGQWGDAPDFVAVDLNSYEPTLGFVWTVLDPLRDYEDGLRANRGLAVIFDDGAVLLGKPVER